MRIEPEPGADNSPVCTRYGSNDSTAAEPTARRYSATHQALHWLTAGLVGITLVLGWIMASAGAKPEILPLWEWHKTLGLLVLAITTFRITWRIVDPPRSATGAKHWSDRLATATHILILIVLILMPTSGYLLSAGAGHPPIIFNVIETAPLMAKDSAIRELGKSVHLAGQWVIYALILLHLLGVFVHIVILRDRILDRMLPPPRN